MSNNNYILTIYHIIANLSACDEQKKNRKNTARPILILIYDIVKYVLISNYNRYIITNS